MIARLHRFAVVAAVAVGAGAFGAAVGGIASIDERSVAPAAPAAERGLPVSAPQECGPRHHGTEV